MLEAETSERLGYSKRSVEGNNTGNSRNGYNKKTIKSEWGESEIFVPRDRNGEFEPKIIEKRQTRTDEIERRILAMYAKGTSVRDVEDQLRDVYGAEVSPTLISNITDKILPQVTERQNRQPDELYPVVFSTAYGKESLHRPERGSRSVCVGRTARGVGLTIPQMLKVWDENWSEVSTFFKYPDEVRRLIYTTNAVKGFHRMLRKYTKTKVVYPTDDALRKSIYLSVQEISKKWTMPMQNWGIIIGRFMIFFEERFKDLKTA